MADISKITLLNGTTYDLKDAVARYHLPYGECETAAATAAKTVTIDGITELAAGLAIVVKFTNYNSIASPTLNLNNLGAKNIRQYGTTNASTSTNTTGWMAGAVVLLVYDGTAWYFNKGYNTNSTYTITSVYCGTAAAEAAKVTSNASYYVLRTGNVFEITMRYANSYQGAITLNVNSTGAKPIWINDAATSASNYTLPAGKYLVYYNGAQYRFRTDDKQPISISGTVNGYGIHKTVPSTAVFTDTTYDAATATPLMDGTGTVGTSEKYAREDHRHPYDTATYRKGPTAVHRVSSVSADPQYVSLIENKSTLEWMQTIRAIAGVGDWFYAAHLNPEYTITSNYSGAHGTKGNFAISTLFSPSGASTVLLDVDSIAQTPFVLTVTKTNGTNITATDVVHLELYTHTLGTTAARLTDYKVELYTTGSTSSSGTYSWQTVYQRSGVSDNPSGLVIPLNPTEYAYLYFSGIRFTISGATPGSTNSAAWNYNCLDLTLFRLVDQRPAFSAARAVGALDISGGQVYGNTTFYGGINGSLTGNASTATKATQDESGNNIKASYASSMSISDHTITLKNKNGASLGTVTVPDNTVEPATEAPLANMDAVVGTSLKYAREDHRHPATKIPPIWCDTLSAETAKVANGNSGYYYSLREGNVFICSMYYANTAQNAITFRIGTTGAKPIYINGEASSSTNYTLPAGTYLVYYDGTAYHFRTDGKIPGPITNNATSSAAGLMSAADKSKLDVITGVAVTDTEPTSDNILAWIDTDSTDTVTLLTQSEVNAQYVSYDHAQTLTSAQQNRALQNVGVTNGTDAQKTNLATFAGISLTVVGTI